MRRRRQNPLAVSILKRIYCHASISAADSWPSAAHLCHLGKLLLALFSWTHRFRQRCQRVNMILCWRLLNGLQASLKERRWPEFRVDHPCRKSCSPLLSFFFLQSQTERCIESSPSSYLGRHLRMSARRWSVPPPSWWGLTCGGPCLQQGQAGETHGECGKEQSAAALPPRLSAPQGGHWWRRRLYRTPSHRRPPSTAHSHNSTKYTSGPGQPAGDIHRETLHMTLVWCYTRPVSSNILFYSSSRNKRGEGLGCWFKERKKHTCFWFVLHLFAFEKFIQTFWPVHELWN